MGSRDPSPFWDALDIAVIVLFLVTDVTAFGLWLVKWIGGDFDTSLLALSIASEAGMGYRIERRRRTPHVDEAERV